MFCLRVFINIVATAQCVSKLTEGYEPDFRKIINLLKPSGFFT